MNRDESGGESYVSEIKCVSPVLSWDSGARVDPGLAETSRNVCFVKLLVLCKVANGRLFLWTPSQTTSLDCSNLQTDLTNI